MNHRVLAADYSSRKALSILEFEAAPFSKLLRKPELILRLSAAWLAACAPYRDFLNRLHKKGWQASESDQKGPGNPLISYLSPSGLSAKHEPSGQMNALS